MQLSIPYELGNLVYDRVNKCNGLLIGYHIMHGRGIESSDVTYHMAIEYFVEENGNKIQRYDHELSAPIAETLLKNNEELKDILVCQNLSKAA